MQRLARYFVPTLLLPLGGCGADTASSDNVYNPVDTGGSAGVGGAGGQAGAAAGSSAAGGGASAAGTGGAAGASNNTAGAAGGSGGDTGTEPDVMEPEVMPPVCGNGEEEGTEQCDDGNTEDGDGCEANCTLTPTEECGNGTQDDGEECDDGNTVDGDGCEANCRITPPPPVCGDGNTDVAEGEECDDGNTVDGDGCEADCTLPPEPVCGDGNQDPGEECDDGNEIPGDGCEPTTCLVTVVDLLSLADSLNGHTITMPCGAFTSTEVCTPMNIGRSFQGDPALEGQISHYEELTFGGDPGTMYDVTVYVRGLVESKVYNGGMDIDSGGSQIPANGLYLGGTPDNSSNGYNVYRLRTESPAANYFLNSVGLPGNNRMMHGVFDTEFTFTFTVEGGSTIIVSSADPNNSAIANCGTEADNQCTEITLQNLDPLIADDVTQPFNGQFIGFVVQDVVPTP